MEYANPAKHLRAKAHAKALGKEDDEDVIKARYVELGGKILHEDDEDVEDVGAKPKKTKKTKEEE